MRKPIHLHTLKPSTYIRKFSMYRDDDNHENDADDDDGGDDVADDIAFEFGNSMQIWESICGNMMKSKYWNAS